MKINIVTPCSRPENLRTLFYSLNFSYHAWYIIFDADEIPQKERNWLEKIPRVFLSNIREGRRGGYLQRNSILPFINEGFCYFLDDDTILHPKFYERINEEYKKNKKRIYIFGQEVAKKRKRKTVIKHGYIDIGQYLVHYSFFKKLQFLKVHNSDGVLIEHLNNSYPDDVVYIDEVLSYYNKLRNGWKEEKK